MFQVKICGVRSSADIEAVAQAAGESRTNETRANGFAIGLNFYPPSVRYVDPEHPVTIGISKAARKGGLLRVGVFVNERAAEIRRIVELVGVDVVQLHGDEGIEIATELFSYGYDVIRAIKLPKQGLTPQLIADRAGPWVDAGCNLLLDADAGASHGGSGKTLDWSVVKAWASKADFPPRPGDLAASTTQSEVAAASKHWTLAGGLTPENVALAIDQSGAISVDTASGVEKPRGVKSAPLIRAFFRAANFGG